MRKYGAAAIRAVELVKEGACKSATEAWRKAVFDAFPSQVPSQKKGCPRAAFLGLCQEGLVNGIPPGAYTNAKKNASYAVQAVKFLRNDWSLSEDKKKLWSLVISPERKVENQQMDVVIALWRSGLIADSPNKAFNSDAGKAGAG